MQKDYRHDMGPGGDCICPRCGATFAHARGVPCQDQRCAQCGARLLREGSYHHKLFLAKHRPQEDDRE